MDPIPRRRPIPNLSIKVVPESIAAALRQRAARHHRSLQGELMAIMEAAAAEPPAPDLAALRARSRALGFEGPGDSTALIRAARDARHGG